jgi:glutathione-specific gamma-glutamylcyclotransferase
MWVFGYGSLVWDSWSERFGCLRRVTAELPGFRRSFDKGSVRNWGSRQEREGKGFGLQPVEVRLESGDRVTAVAPIYSGKNLLSGKSLAELAAMARIAQGVDGKCIDYARNIATKLAELGIDDPEVDEFRRALE